MAKKTKPVITHTEILSRAIQSVEAEINDWRRRCKDLPKDQVKTYFDAATEELNEKLDALKSMYIIETGNVWL